MERTDDLVVESANVKPPQESKETMATQDMATQDMAAEEVKTQEETVDSQDIAAKEVKTQEENVASQDMAAEEVKTQEETVASQDLPMIERESTVETKNDEQEEDEATEGMLIKRNQDVLVEAEGRCVGLVRICTGLVRVTGCAFVIVGPSVGYILLVTSSVSTTVKTWATLAITLIKTAISNVLIPWISSSSKWLDDWSVTRIEFASVVSAITFVVVPILVGEQEFTFPPVRAILALYTPRPPLFTWQ